MRLITFFTILKYEELQNESFFGDMCLPIFITIVLHELFIKSLKLFINKHVTR